MPFKFNPFTGKLDITNSNTGGGTTDHSALSNLGNDDHPQYHNDTRGDLRYYTQSAADTLLGGKADTAHTHTKADITDLNDADYATAAQGSLADTATQPGDLATVATTGDYDDLINVPTIPTETVTSLDLAANILTFTDENGDDTDLDLSLYIDDTNLSRILSGSVDVNGIATFTRDDASTFTIDFSNLLDNQTAVDVPVTATGNLSATDSQAAFEELQGDIDTINAAGYITSAPVDSVNGQTGVVVVSANDVGLGNVDNTADTDKPVSTAQQTALDGKVDDAQELTNVPSGAVFTDTVYDDTTIQAEVDLNTAKNSYPTADETKLAGIENNATANDTDANLLNRSNHTGTQPVSTITGLGSVATSDDYNDLINTPTIPAAAPVDSVNGQTGIVVLDASDVGLGNVDNTSDANKPVSTATQTALDAKSDVGHTHTASDITDFDTEVSNNADVVANTAKNSYPAGDQTKLAGIESGATGDQTDAEIETAYNNQVDVVTQLEAEAGTLTDVKRWTPERVKQAIDALATGGGGGGGLTVNIESLTANKTIDSSVDEDIHILDNNDAYRTVFLDTASSVAGDIVQIKSTNSYSSNRYITVAQTGGGTLDNLFGNGVARFYFDGTDWDGLDLGSGGKDVLSNNISIGKQANAYNDSIVIGASANGNNKATAVGQFTNGNLRGVAIGHFATSYTYGASVGYGSQGYSYGAAIGYNAKTNGKYGSVALGHNSETERYAEVAHNINYDDTAQLFNKFDVGVSGTTTSATTTELLAGGVASQRMTVMPSSSITFTVQVSARDNTAGDCAAYEFKGCIKRDAADLTELVGVVEKNILAEEDTTWDCSVVADDTNEALVVEVVGDATNTVQWAARITGVETKY